MGGHCGRGAGGPGQGEGRIRAPSPGTRHAVQTALAEKGGVYRFWGMDGLLRGWTGAVQTNGAHIGEAHDGKEKKLERRGSRPLGSAIHPSPGAGAAAAGVSRGPGSIGCSGTGLVPGTGGGAGVPWSLWFAALGLGQEAWSPRAVPRTSHHLGAANLSVFWPFALSAYVSAYVSAGGCHAHRHTQRQPKHTKMADSGGDVHTSQIQRFMA